VAGTRMVVVGGDAAGMSAATQARRRRPPEELEVVAFERGRHVSYSACGLPYYAGDVVKDWRDLVARTPEEFAEQDIDVRTRHDVEAIDLEAGRARVHDLDGGRVIEEPWDVLVVATGSEPLRP
jgi:NADPH-dependent 2,4-dienoyl-CoA reductase/sulfur reductase-like enzyme